MDLSSRMINISKIRHSSFHLHIFLEDFNSIRAKPCHVNLVTCPFSRLNFTCTFRTFFLLRGARSKGFATLRNVSKLTFFEKIGHPKCVGFRFYSAIWRNEGRISSRYLEITSTSLIYSLTFSRKKELLIWLSRGLNRLTCVTRQIRGDSKLRD